MSLLCTSHFYTVPLTVREDVVQIPEKVPCTAWSAIFCFSDWKLGWCPHRDIDPRTKDLPKSKYTKLQLPGDYRCNTNGTIFYKDDPAKKIEWTYWGDNVAFFERELLHEPEEKELVHKPEAGSMRCLNGDMILESTPQVIISGLYPIPPL